MIAALINLSLMANLFSASAQPTPTCSWTDTPGTYACADGHMYVFGKLQCSNDDPNQNYKGVFCLPEKALDRKGCGESDPQSTDCMKRYIHDQDGGAPIQCTWGEKKTVVCDNKKYIQGNVNCVLYQRDVFCEETEFKDNPFGCAFLEKNIGETHNCQLQVNAMSHPSTIRSLGVAVPHPPSRKHQRPAPLQPAGPVPVPGTPQGSGTPTTP